MRPGFCQHWLSCEDWGQCLACGTSLAGCRSPHQFLLIMGTLSCDPEARLATVPLARRVAEGHIPETGLRKSCGTATLENGLCWPGGEGLLLSPYWDGLESSRGSICRQVRMSLVGPGPAHLPCWSHVEHSMAEAEGRSWRRVHMGNCRAIYGVCEVPEAGCSAEGTFVYDGQWGQISPYLRWCFSKTGLSFPSRTIFLSWAQFPHLPTNPVMISLFRFSFPPSIFLCPQTQFPYLWWSLCPGPSFFSCKLLSALACFSTHDSLFVPSLSFPICDSVYAFSFSNPRRKLLCSQPQFQHQRRSLLLTSFLC